ncbi:MAG: endonuclease/exonuclease/phosphatase family protein [Pseudomonadota bacterium]|nr:endonuclease/exonuclease/phosphatase family protein [Pseudomonadota bacterium]
MRWVIKGALLLLLLLTLTAYLGTFNPYFELTTHFRVQYLALALFSLPFLLGSSQWLTLAFMIVILNGITIVPLYSAPATHPEGVHIKLLLANVHYLNKRYSELIQLIETEHPTIAVIQEATQTWKQQLTRLNTLWPYRYSTSDSGVFGIILLSQITIDSSAVVVLSRSGREGILAHFSVDGKALALLTIHPLPPYDPTFLQYRNQQLANAEKILTPISTPKIVMGDLNVTPWSPYYRQLLKGSGLRNARKGFGILPTWPSWSLLDGLRIPIDHCLVNSAIEVINIKTIPIIGSDHLSLVIDIAV